MHVLLQRILIHDWVLWRAWLRRVRLDLVEILLVVPDGARDEISLLSVDVEALLLELAALAQTGQVVEVGRRQCLAQVLHLDEALLVHLELLRCCRLSSDYI